MGATVAKQTDFLLAATVVDSGREVRLMRFPLAILCLLSLTTAAHAVPTCVPGTMADYLTLIDGCRLGGYHRLKLLLFGQQ